MEERHSFALQQKIDELLDYGSMTITTTEFMRFHAKARIGKRMRRSLAEEILRRVEAECNEGTEVLVYECGDGRWSFVLKDEWLVDLDAWAGKE